MFQKVNLFFIILQTIFSIKCYENDVNCGLMNTNSQNRIVGGSDARKSEFPFMVSLQRNGRHLCGATLLNKRWILTAAHCIDKGDVKDLNVIIGTEDNREKHFEYSVEKTIMNGCYDKTYLIHDIGLIKTDRDMIPFDFNNGTIGSICLPEPDSEPSTRHLLTAGWGKFEKYGTRTAFILQKAQNMLFHEKYCLFADLFSGLFLTPGWTPFGYKLCVQSDENSICSGDSGGPLIEVRNGKAYQLGVTSHDMTNPFIAQFGYRCYPSEPTGFTKVSKYIDWIDSTVQFYSNSSEKENTNTECNIH